MPCLTRRGLCLALATFIMIGGGRGIVSAQTAPSTIATDRTPAVYVEYAGPVDKPVLPIVIFHITPPQDEMVRVLGSVQGMLAHTAQISELDLGVLIGSLEVLLETADKAAVAGAPGSFRVTMVDGSGDLVHVLGERDAPRLLQLLTDLGDGRYETLKTWTANISHRLAIGGAP